MIFGKECEIVEWIMKIFAKICLVVSVWCLVFLLFQVNGMEIRLQVLTFKDRTTKDSNHTTGAHCPSEYVLLIFIKCIGRLTQTVFVATVLSASAWVSNFGQKKCSEDG